MSILTSFLLGCIFSTLLHMNSTLESTVKSLRESSLYPSKEHEPVNESEDDSSNVYEVSSLHNVTEHKVKGGK
ncbi:hypothetical protein [Shewanella metallivivens]|uniref:Lipoprotein n=1 Tax=Shewanella metallivivens TaxID=2872342 RepID=A0ABT5TMK3_9GAMM|nr:hypothetical protein [Shewanella metallivivens]MDD8058651.1 hypothetical protein [Shewanella metallivivens]